MAIKIKAWHIVVTAVILFLFIFGFTDYRGPITEWIKNAGSYMVVAMNGLVTNPSFQQIGLFLLIGTLGLWFITGIIFYKSWSDIKMAVTRRTQQQISPYTTAIPPGTPQLPTPPPPKPET